MRYRGALPALVVLLLAGCATGTSTGQGSAEPATTGGQATTTAPDAATAPSTGRDSRPATRPAPSGVVPDSRRQAAPDLRVTSFDGGTVTLGGFRGQPAVVNFFESW
jgi:hypothetical protein